MNKELITFDLGDFGNLRGGLGPDGEPWFCCADIARSLEYKDTNMPKTFAHVPDIWKGRDPIPTPGGTQAMLCVSEQGLYFFLGRSDKPGALPYQMKVAGEVMPSIRKRGYYALPGARPADPEAEGQRARVFQAECFVTLAKSPFYTDVMATCFTAKALAIVRREPEDRYLPPVRNGDGRELWLGPADLARRLSEDLDAAVTKERVGKLLKRLGLDGPLDTGRVHSEPFNDFTAKVYRQKFIYKYNPETVYPPLRAACLMCRLKPRPESPGQGGLFRGRLAPRKGGGEVMQ